jgi:hypothetical protein
MPPLPQTPLSGAPKVGAPAPAPLAAPALLAPPPIVRCFFVPPPNLPALPPAPPPKPTWMAVRNPSAHNVQQQYVDQRLEELEAERRPGMNQSLKVLNGLLTSQPRYAGKKIPRKELERIYEALERNLQSAELTINFDAASFFGDENDSETYTQMYQQAVKNGRMELRSTQLNNAQDRARVDDQVTFPANWQGVQTPQRRGLSPGRQGADRIMRQMDTGGLVPSASTQFAYNASNKYFNPDTKQLFTALNFGRRPHGSLAYWGYSYFALKSELKPRCFYYPGDTFEQKDKPHCANALQVPYDNLGAILGKSDATSTGRYHRYLNSEIVKACVEGQILRDAGIATGSIEAHFFGELRFSEHVDYMVISPTQIMNRLAWPRLVENARKFAAKHGFKLYQMD